MIAALHEGFFPLSKWGAYTCDKVLDPASTQRQQQSHHTRPLVYLLLNAMSQLDRKTAASPPGTALKFDGGAQAGTDSGMDQGGG